MEDRGDRMGWKKAALGLLLSLAVALLFMLPRLERTKLHPLHDVGFNLAVLAQLDHCGGVGEYLETAARNRPQRFYPAYWVGQHLLWRLGGRSLDLFIPANLVMLALLFFVAALLAMQLGGYHWFAILVLAAAPGMVENCHTIMKQELPLALSQALLLLCLLPLAGREPLPRSRFLLCTGGAVATSLFAGLLKETAAIAGLALLAWWVWVRLFARHLRPPRPRTITLLLLALLSLALGVAAFLLREPGEYTGAVSFSPGVLLSVAGAYLQRLWLWALLAILAGTMLYLRHRGEEKGGPVLLAVILCGGWLAGYLPWQTTQVRYLLPGFVLLAPLAAGALGRDLEFWKGQVHRLRLPAYLLLALVLLLLFQALGAHRAESAARLMADRSVRFLRHWLDRRPKGARVLVMLPEDEPIQELRAQMAALHGRGDLVIEPLLKGRGFEAWKKGLLELKASPPADCPIILPFVQGLPEHADRVFPLDEDLHSAVLEGTLKSLLGPALVEVKRFPADKRLPLAAGFKIFRYNANGK